MSITDRNRSLFAAGLALLGLLTMFIDDRLINTPAHLIFFENINRMWVGLFQVLAAAVLVLPVLLPRLKAQYNALTAFPYVLVCFMWAAVAFYPYTQDAVGNIVSVISWALVALGVRLACSYDRAEVQTR